MTDIQKAKRSLGRELRNLEGFVGIGIDRNVIRIYANSEAAPVVTVLQDRWGDAYEGFAVSVVLTNGFEIQTRGA